MSTKTYEIDLRKREIEEKEDGMNQNKVSQL